MRTTASYVIISTKVETGGGEGSGDEEGKTANRRSTVSV